MPQVVFRHLGADPDVVQADQGHHRAAGAGELAHFRSQIGNQAAGARAHLAIAQVQLGLHQRGGGALQAGVVFAAATFLLARALHLGAGSGNPAHGFAEGGAGDFQAAQGNGAAVLAIQAFEAVTILARLEFIGFGRLQVADGRVDTGGIGADLPAHRFEVGAGTVGGDLVSTAVDLEQQLACLYALVVMHVHGGDTAGHFGRHRYDEGLYPRLLGVRRVAVGQQVPEQAQTDDDGHASGAPFGWVGLGGGGLFAGASVGHG